jgi:hypothetical protein
MDETSRVRLPDALANILQTLLYIVLWRGEQENDALRHTFVERGSAASWDVNLDVSQYLFVLHVINGLHDTLDGVAIVHLCIIPIGNGTQPNPKTTTLVTQGPARRKVGQDSRTHSLKAVQVSTVGQNVGMERKEKIRYAVEVLDILCIRDGLAL